MRNKYGKNVFVTGATSGIGKSCAISFAKAGCNVIGVSRNAEEKTIKYGDGSITYKKMDVTDIDSIKEVFENIKDIDIAVLSAGMGIGGAAYNMPISMVRRQFEVNYFGVLNTLNKVLPIMRKRNHGLVLIISSVGGIIPLPMQSHYSSSKFALESLIEALSIEMKEYNVKFTLIEPGDTKTGFTKARKTYNPVNSPYHDVCEDSIKKISHDEKHGKSPESVSKVALKLANKKNPPIRVAIGIEYKLVCFLKRILPDRLIDYILYKLYMPNKKN